MYLCEHECLSPSMGFRDQSQVTMLGGKHLTLLSHLTRPKI